MLLKLPGVIISEQAEAKLRVYYDLLLKWQKSVNLVSSNTISDAWNRHFMDSIQIANLVSREAKVIDIGSGAGFPGLVLSPLLDLNLHLIDSDDKKSQFMKSVSREANIPAVIHNARVENVDIDSPDYITSRALADLSKLLELTEKWWLKNKKINLIFLKGKNAETELEQAKAFFKFDCDIYQSNTDPSGRILKLTNIHRIP